MSYWRGTLALLGIVSALNGSAYAGSTFKQSAYPAMPVLLSANGDWASACTPIIPPFAVFAETTGKATLTVRRYADASCRLPLDIDTPLPVHNLTQSPRCPSAGFCGDQGTPDLTPALAIEVVVHDTTGAAGNRVLIASVTQDPPEAPPVNPYTGEPVRPHE